MISKMTVNGVDKTSGMLLWKFPAGEVGVKINADIKDNDLVAFTVEYQNSDDIMYILNLYDAIVRLADVDQVWFDIPYLPYSRQDRVCHGGESFALEVLANLFNSLPKASFSTVDAHSAVSNKLINKLAAVKQSAITDNLPHFNFFIAPDQGAKSKINCLGTGPNEAVLCLNKVRKDGKVVYEDLPEDTVWGTVCVVDDLCDGGATFIALGEMLKRTQPKVTSYSLYVTHGLFTKGLDELESVYSEFYVGNLVNKELLSNPKVKVI